MLTQEEIGTYLKELRNKKKLSLRDVDNLTGITYSHLNMIEHGTRNVTPALLKNLANIYNIDYLELYEKAGYIELIEEDKRHIISSTPKGVQVPVLGYIKAGIPIDAIEEIIDYEEIPLELAKKGKFFALTVKGDSMSPDIKNGDIAIFLSQSDINSGEIAAVIFNGNNEATLKRVYKDDTGINLVPDNLNNSDNFKPTHYTFKEIEQIPITIAGKLMEVRKKYYR